jgi:hypothetical protein
VPGCVVTACTWNGDMDECPLGAVACTCTGSWLEATDPSRAARGVCSVASPSTWVLPLTPELPPGGSGERKDQASLLKITDYITDIYLDFLFWSINLFPVLHCFC